MARGNRVAGIVASALLFGAVSGGTMVGVNVLADQHRSEIVASVNELTGQEQKESTSPIQKTVAKDKDDTSSAKTTASGEESVSKIAKDAMSSVVSITPLSISRTDFLFTVRDRLERRQPAVPE